MLLNLPLLYMVPSLDFRSSFSLSLSCLIFFLTLFLFLFFTLSLLFWENPWRQWWRRDSSLSLLKTGSVQEILGQDGHSCFGKSQFREIRTRNLFLKGNIHVSLFGMLQLWQFRVSGLSWYALRLHQTWVLLTLHFSELFAIIALELINVSVSNSVFSPSNRQPIFQFTRILLLEFPKSWAVPALFWTRPIQ